LWWFDSHGFLLSLSDTGHRRGELEEGVRVSVSRDETEGQLHSIIRHDGNPSPQHAIFRAEI